MKVALVYDRVNKWGGAERVLLALHELFPDAPLFTSVHHSGRAAWAKVFDVRTSFLQKFPHVIENHEFYPFLMPIAFENLELDEYDLVISVTSEAAKGVMTKPGTKHICYCLTPTRYLWSGYDEYLNSKTKKFLAYPVVSYLRKWDKMAARRPDTLVALSDEVRKRIKKYYGMDAYVIHPPNLLTDEENKETKKGDHFLIVSRFVPYKKIDLAIKACNALGLKLKIIGTGREAKYLKKIAGPTIEFLGTVKDSDLKKSYRESRALIFPGVEDFGLTVVEAQAMGTPVIAFRGGGALETIAEGKTGVFFDEQTLASLAQALRKFEEFRPDPKECKKQAERFSISRFKEKFLELVNRI